MIENSRSKDDFITPRSTYWGEVTLPNLTFNANLQEFAQRVSLVCNLETGGKITPDDAYQEIKALWKQLKESKKNILDAPRPNITPEDFEEPKDDSPEP
ncbi:MAG: hypothetical protein F6K42_22220 [Leptolyngbya sp. SIO1D8]|nr:hypothetical protein [Leptolyngbya sp. SIO1D8]